MTQKITAIFNGEPFYPTEKIELEPNTEVQLSIDINLITENQLKAMANDPNIQAEIKAINQEFLLTEMDGLTDNEN